MSEKFHICVWSKVKYSEKLKNDLIREKVEKRFESVIPFIKIDVVYLENGEK